MKAEYKLQMVGEHLIAEALRFRDNMKLNERAFQIAKTKQEKDAFEEGSHQYRARWAVCMDIIERLGIEDEYYTALSKHLDNQ